MKGILTIEPSKRYTIEDIKKDPWFTRYISIFYEYFY